MMYQNELQSKGFKSCECSDEIRNNVSTKKSGFLWLDVMAHCLVSRIR